MAEERPPLASVDAVRDELRRLGYLDRGLDRFVLAGAVSASPLRAAARAGLRVALAGGALFGAALTLAAAGLTRGLRGEPRDLAVLALYLTVGSGLATGALAFLLGLLAGALGRSLEQAPAQALARKAGIALGAAGLFYVGFWWLSHAEGESIGFSLAVVALGLVGCAALVRFGTLAALAVLSTGGGHLPHAGAERRALRPLLAIAGGLLLCGMALVSLRSQAAPATPDFAVVPTGLRVCVVGVDGLERRMTDAMIAQGAMPNLARLREAGAHATLQAEPEQVPAIVWTTIATGRGPESHGVHSVGARRLAGMRLPVDVGQEGRFARALGAATDLLRLTRTEPASAVLRGSKTFWNVAADKGLRIGIVNWWATWPADSVNGFIVSDRAFFKLEKREPAEREVHPPEAFARLAALLPVAESRAERIDRFHLAALRALAAQQPPDLLALYLPGLDIVSTQQLGDAAVADLSSLDRRLETVRAYYRTLDTLLGELVRGLGPQEVLVLAGDPGRLARRAPGPTEGVLVLAGSAVAHTDLGAVSERDIAPTVLHLLGVPHSRELAGRVLEAAFQPDFARAHPRREIASYGGPRRPRATESAFDPEVIEQLRSLGYIQ